MANTGGGDKGWQVGKKDPQLSGPGSWVWMPFPEDGSPGGNAFGKENQPAFVWQCQVSGPPDIWCTEPA